MSSAMNWAKQYDMNKIVAITKRNILKKTDGLFFDESSKCNKKSFRNAT